MKTHLQLGQDAILRTGLFEPRVNIIGLTGKFTHRQNKTISEDMALSGQHLQDSRSPEKLAVLPGLCVTVKIKMLTYS
jgi:hypothetical protein